MTEDLDAAAALDSPHLDPLAYLAHLRDRHRQTRFHDVGYPVARDIDFAPVEALAVEGMWNNIGDPRTDPPGGNHTKSAERALLAWAGRLFGFPDSDRWGYVTTGGTEANFAGLRAARDSFPLDAHHATTAVAYYSAAAHYSIPKCLQELAVPAVRVRAHPDGEMDYRDLARRVSEHPGRPAVVVLTIGTTMTEAVDDPEAVSAVLDEQDIPGRYLHLDAALTGIPYALDGHLPLGLADSVGFSGYKFLGTPRICGLVLGRRRTMLVDQDIDYTATIDSTFTGSRDGLAALQMWYAVARYGNDGHRKRAAAARNLAGYLVDELERHRLSRVAASVGDDRGPAHRRGAGLEAGARPGGRHQSPDHHAGYHGRAGRGVRGDRRGDLPSAAGPHHPGSAAAAAAGRRHRRAGPQPRATSRHRRPAVVVRREQVRLHHRRPRGPAEVGGLHGHRPRRGCLRSGGVAATPEGVGSRSNA